MAEFTQHQPGTFSWVELATTDQRAAVAFYRSLFGWNVNEQPLGPGEVYTLFQVRGKDVAAAYTMRDDERKMGIPPHWNMYVAVANADQIVERAKTLGATVLVAPFDVMEVGRMAVLQDPAGAVFCLWQAKSHVGAKILNEPGALCWSELTTRDPKAAEAFYTALFGWTAKHSAPSAVMDYTEFSVGGQPSIGMMEMPKDMPPTVPSFWMPYFQVADCDATIATAKASGGRLMMGPQDIANTGRFGILADPLGAAFAVFTFAPAIVR